MAYLILDEGAIASEPFDTLADARTAANVRHYVSRRLTIARLTPVETIDVPAWVPGDPVPGGR